VDQSHVNPYNARRVELSQPLAPGTAMASPTAVEFALDFEDYLAWNLHKLTKTPGFVKQRRRRMIIMMVVYLALGVIMYVQLIRISQFMAWGFAGVMIVMAVLSAVFLPIRYRRAIRQNVNLVIGQDPNEALFGHRRLEIAPSGLFLKGELFESMFRWPMVVRLDVTDQHAFFDIGGAGAVIVPRAAFTHDAVFQAFIAAARHFQQQAAQRQGAG
jgi:hypothetical protein